MKLNLDCVRDILLCVEEHTGPRSRCVFVDTFQTESMRRMGLHTIEPADYQINLMEKYDIDEIMYHIKYCFEADLIVVVDGSSQYQQQIADLTPKGHDFLANIRNTSNWEKTKDVGKKVGAFGLNMAAKIAEGVATAYLNQQLKLL